MLIVQAKRVEYAQRGAPSALSFIPRRRLMRSLCGFFMCLSRPQWKEGLFNLVRTMSCDRLCTDVRLEDSDLAALAAQIYNRHGEWLQPGGPSGVNRLRPQNYKGGVCVSGACVADVVHAATRGLAILP